MPDCKNTRCLLSSECLFNFLFQACASQSSDKKTRQIIKVHETCRENLTCKLQPEKRILKKTSQIVAGHTTAPQLLTKCLVKTVTKWWEERKVKSIGFQKNISIFKRIPLFVSILTLLSQAQKKKCSTEMSKENIGIWNVFVSRRITQS